MPGEISKKLLNQVRDRLKDHNKIIISSDETIYQYFTHYQKILMLNFLTTTTTQEISLENNTKIYPILNIYKIISITPEGFELKDLTEYEIINDPMSLKISGFPDNSSLIVYGYCYPLEIHDINKDNDPILNPLFQGFLVECVLSHYINIDKSFLPLNIIFSNVQEMTYRLNEISPISKIKTKNIF